MTNLDKLAQIGLWCVISQDDQGHRVGRGGNCRWGNFGGLFVAYREGIQQFASGERKNESKRLIILAFVLRDHFSRSLKE